MPGARTIEIDFVLYKWPLLRPILIVNRAKRPWQETCRKGFKSDDALFISFDPHMFDRRRDQVSPNPGSMQPSDIVRAAASLLDLVSKPVVIQLSTYSARYGNAQDDVIREVAPVFHAIGLEFSTIVWANRNMMSMVFSRGVPQISDAQLQQRFSTWLRQATAPDRIPDGRVAAKQLNGPLPNEAPSSVMEASMTGYVSGNTKTTQIGYINRNQQQCAGHRGIAGTDHDQRAYRMECLKPLCGHVYGANGTDVFQRRCPKCGGGKPGIAF